MESGGEFEAILSKLPRQTPVSLVYRFARSANESVSPGHMDYWCEMSADEAREWQRESAETLAADLQVDIENEARYYRPTLYEVHNKETKISKFYYCLEEYLQEKDRAVLAPYCQCPKCTGNFMKRAFVCACCVGCLHSDMPQGSEIKRARAHKKSCLANPTPQTASTWLCNIL